MTIKIPLQLGVVKCSLLFRTALSANIPAVKSTIASIRTLAVKKKKKHYDPYKLAQIKLKKDANLSRQKFLRDQRQAATGDPVRGITTPFVQSFDNVGESTLDPEATEKSAPILNHFLTPSELEDAFKSSDYLASPLIPENRTDVDPVKEKILVESHKAAHANAVEAVRRIVNLSNGCSFDKTTANKIRCIEKFGRHNTDKFLKPRPPVHPSLVENKVLPVKTPRAGPDTGSSEVQIAILTAKIRVLSDKLEEPGGKKDKMNKRNLRLLVHRRQKLLKYLRRKERGGERWQYLVDTLGLTEGTWKNEISL
ncbi:hypothetical protein K3495_g1355 [Podosphaera aphanis]|nr:hypothetical protein K3495_g1355 [Podosphaera aphanis]